MPWKKITHYSVFHNIGNTSIITIYYEGGVLDTVKDLPVTEALYIVDLLRNESPMSYNNEFRSFSSFAELVGENE